VILKHHKRTLFQWYDIRLLGREVQTLLEAITMLRFTSFPNLNKFLFLLLSPWSCTSIMAHKESVCALLYETVGTSGLTLKDDLLTIDMNTFGRKWSLPNLGNIPAALCCKGKSHMQTQWGYEVFQSRFDSGNFPNTILELVSQQACTVWTENCVHICALKLET